MPDTAPSNTNQRVTIAVLGTKMDHMIDLQEKQVAVADAQEKRIRANELAIVKHSEQIRNRSWIIGIAQAISTGIGAVFGNR